MSSTKSTSAWPLRRSFKTIGVLALMAYPFVVYFGLGRFSPRIIVAGIAALLTLRMVFSSEQGLRRRLPYIAGAFALIILATASPMVGLKAYPIVISLTFGVVFAYSLLRPPTIIEEMVRLRRPDLPSHVTAYLRNVTIVWLVFFMINASISAATAFSGSIKLWTLYNGFITYLIMGGLLTGEFLLRPAEGTHTPAWRS
jgi:uncharacterized membrane protein